MGKLDYMDSAKVRETFLEFFRSKQHVIVPSAPMVIKNDPTLMFTNAGMNQFKDVILGNSPVVHPRVADSQKCLRVSGKHNDLEEVGHDTYHHTMFEMLGNWSFGDYFKKEAIEWAWELLTEIYGLKKDRIYATIFEGDKKDGVERDNEAYEQWAKFLPEDRIILGNKEDNFWEMGDIGPCGPCSEIHYDVRSDEERKKLDGGELVNKDHPLVIEIWNLVFMQFNRRANGSLEPLPAQHVDTGMGFERLCMIMQNVQSNYDTDVFQPIIQKLAQLSDKKYGDNEDADIAMRVMSDHVRAIAFSIADGQLPSNVQAGYVIRRILRRAVRYGYTFLGFNEPILYKLVDILVEQMGEQFPELKAQQTLIENVIREEENSFLNTLATGTTMLDNVIKKHKERGEELITGKDAFTLYDTYGFPIDLTQLIAREQEMKIDIEEFRSELEAQKERSRSAAAIDADDWVEVAPITESLFVGYEMTEADVKIARYREMKHKNKSYYQLVLDQTPFYGNSGGQIGDTGYIESDGEKTVIRDTQKDGNLTIHIVDKLPSDVEADFKAVVNVDKRKAIAANHTATHLLHEALRDVLGKHVEQKGSLVSDNYLRFDFSHFQKMTHEELKKVEKQVNRRIRDNIAAVELVDCTVEQAEEMGALMLFGEKYGESVRVMKFGSSVELCGGTHVEATGSIGLFKIRSEGAISAGVRRIEAITGVTAESMIYVMEATIQEIQDFVNNPKIMQGVRRVFEENEELQQQVEEYKKEKIDDVVNTLIEDIKERDGIKLFYQKINIPAEMLKDVAFGIRQRVPNLVLVLGSDHEDKAALTIMLGDEIVERGIDAGKVIREAAKEIQGGGGGQPHFATAGGRDPQGVDKAITKAVDIIKAKLG